jgi:hypothetical protein
MLQQIASGTQKQPQSLQQESEWIQPTVLCRECDREVYRALSHKRFRIHPESYEFIGFSEWLKQYQWSDIEYITFTEEWCDVVYLDEFIKPKKGIDSAQKTGESQISLI